MDGVVGRGRGGGGDVGVVDAIVGEDGEDSVVLGDK